MLTATAFSVCGSVRRLSDTALICALGLVLRRSAMLLIHHSLDGRAMLFVLAERYLAMATMLKPIMCKPPGCCNCSSARLLLMIQDALNKHSATRIFLALFQIFSRTVPANALSPAPDMMTSDGQRPTIGAPTLRIAGPDNALHATVQGAIGVLRLHLCQCQPNKDATVKDAPRVLRCQLIYSVRSRTAKLQPTAKCDDSRWPRKLSPRGCM